MKRKFLEDLGIEKDAVDKIMSENGNDINAVRVEVENIKKELGVANQTITDRDKQLEDLKVTVGESETLQGQIAQLQKENKKSADKYEADMKDLKVATAIKLALGDRAHDPDLATSLFDKTKLILGEDGKITGLEEQLKTLKESKSFLFKEEQQQTVIKGGTPAIGTGTPPTGKKTSEMNYTELCAYMEANPGATI